MTHLTPEIYELVGKWVIATLIGEFFMGFTRYRSLIWFFIVMFFIALGLAISPVFKLFRRKK